MTGSPALSITAALGQVVIIVGIGYLLRYAGKVGMLKEVNTINGTVLLPALLFRSVAELELSTVPWKFIASLLVGKLSLFAATAGIVYAAVPGEPRARFKKAGIYALIVCQSNDIPFGAPLYGAMDPTMQPYVFLLSSLHAVLVTPLGFLLLEAGRPPMQSPARRAQEGELEGEEAARLQHEVAAIQKRMSEHRAKRVWRLMLSIATNPAVSMILTALVYNVALGSAADRQWHMRLPPFIDNLLLTVGDAFVPLALISIGGASYGKLYHLASRIKIPLALACAKALVCPMVLWMCATFSTDSDQKDLRQFAWIYGSLPTAPAVYVFATQYDSEPAMVAGTILLSLLLTTPLMYVFTFLVTVSPTSEHESNLVQVINASPAEVGIASILACVVMLTCVALNHRRIFSAPTALTVTLLVAAQLLLSVFANVCHAHPEQDWVYLLVLSLRWLCPSVLAILSLVSHRDRRCVAATAAAAACACAGGCALMAEFGSSSADTDLLLRCYWRYGRTQYVFEAGFSGLLMLTILRALMRTRSCQAAAPEGSRQAALLSDSRALSCIESPGRVASLQLGWVVFLSLVFCRSVYCAVHPSMDLLDSPSMVQLTFLIATFLNAQGLFTAVCLATDAEMFSVLKAAALSISSKFRTSLSSVKGWYSRLSGGSLASQVMHTSSSVPQGLYKIPEDEEPVVLYGDWTPAEANEEPRPRRGLLEQEPSPVRRRMVRNHVSEPDFRVTEANKLFMPPRPP